MDSGK
jgi:hypothetical protein